MLRSVLSIGVPIALGMQGCSSGGGNGAAADDGGGGLVDPGRADAGVVVCAPEGGADSSTGLSPSGELKIGSLTTTA